MDATDFIRQNLRLAPVPGLATLIYQAHPGSGLGRLGGAAPFWAYPWAGGMALAHHLRAVPGLVSGLRVLDLGAGSGLVGIAAAQAGARPVLAAETDPQGRAAIELNATANGVTIMVMAGNPLRQPPPAVDVVLAGDVFYDPARAPRMLRYLDRCAAAGALVLIGDPGRPALPRARLTQLATYPVRDMGDPPGSAVQAGVFRLTA